MTSKGKRPTETAGAEPLAYSVTEFCRLHRFSRAMFYALPEADRPKIMKVGKRTLISAEAARVWRVVMERRAGQRA